MRGKLIVLEGTDGSGKKTQSELLREYLNKNGLHTEMFSFPNYNSPTGKIVGGPFLGQKYISECWFPEGPSHVDPKVACLYYAADRRYNIDKIKLLLDHGIHVILDRYTYSNMAHHGGRIPDKQKREEIYHWIDNLEFNLLELPRPDIRIFLHVPIEVSEQLMNNADRHEKDKLESSKSNQICASKAYEEICHLFDFAKIECCIEGQLRPIFEIHDEVVQVVMNYIQNSKHD